MLMEDVRATRAREARVRRALANDGYRLAKCRRGYGGYAIIDVGHNFLIAGLSADGRGYDWPLDWVEDWMSD